MSFDLEGIASGNLWIVIFNGIVNALIFPFGKWIIHLPIIWIVIAVDVILFGINLRINYRREMPQSVEVGAQT